MPKYFVDVRLYGWASTFVEADSPEEAREIVEEQGVYEFIRDAENDADGELKERIEVNTDPEPEDEDE